jgi:transcriptional regulator with XRE-family HTH domain
MHTIALLVDNLFKMRRRPDGKEYSYQEVENALEKRLTASYVRKLRTGLIPNPGRDALIELCTFFRVPISYFFPELEQEDASAYRQEEYEFALTEVEELVKHQEKVLRYLERASRLVDQKESPRLAQLIERGRSNQERLEKLAVHHHVSQR